MGPKKGRKMRVIEIPTDIPSGFELGDKTAEFQRRRGERGQREREEAQRQQREEGGQEVENTLSREGIGQKWTQKVKERWTHLNLHFYLYEHLHKRLRSEGYCELCQ